MTEQDLPGIEAGNVQPDPFPHITALADQIALRLSFTSGEEGFHPNQVLGIAKEIGGRLSGEETHRLFGSVAIHPNVEPLENGRFAFRDETVFTPQSENFEAAPGESNPKSSQHALSPRQLAVILRNMRFSPEAKEARQNARRIANPRGTRKSRSQQGGPRKSSQGVYHGKKISLGTLIAQTNG